MEIILEKLLIFLHNTDNRVKKNAINPDYRIHYGVEKVVHFIKKSVLGSFTFSQDIFKIIYYHSTFNISKNLQLFVIVPHICIS